MTPAARHAAAIAVLDRWTGGEPVERALTAWARGARYAGSGDRAAVRDIVYGILRNKGRAEVLGGAATGRALVLGYLRLQGADIGEVFSGVRHAPETLSEAEAALAGTPAEAPVTLDCPDWLWPRLQADLGAAAEDVLASMGTRAPLYLRVNVARTTREAAIEALALDGVEAVPDQACGTALRVVHGERRVKGGTAYRDGLVEPQDLSVQIACAAVDWPETGRVLDYCAGGGGKALAIAAARPGVEVVAHDAVPRRMADLAARADRAGARIAMAKPGAIEGPFDLVLCDVPCSGSGTWRRDPEAKWRLTPDGLRDLEAVQQDILRDAEGLVRPGGRLVYMTCSLLRSENDDAIAAFLADRPGWSVAQRLALDPASASDGFFMAELCRA